MPDDREGLDRLQSPTSGYRKHLARINEVIRDGGSLSGHELNCAFLNTRDDKFATVSAVTGLDFPDDARAPAVVDWDHDGDLDLWVANRTGPMVRLLRNDQRSGNHWLSLRLQGTACNRDAIGARVVVHLADGSPSISKTLHAGEGYLGQSSKRIHFGLGGCSAIDHAIIHWPGGGDQRLSSLEVDRHYTIVQGQEAVANELPKPAVPLVPQTLATGQVDSGSRVLISGRFPMPALQYVTASGEAKNLLLGSGRPVLINLWASWCSSCIGEFNEWTKHAERLQQLDLFVYVLSIDELDQVTENDVSMAYASLDRIELPFYRGECTRHTLEQLQNACQWPFHRRIPLVVPTSILFDENGELAAIYRGTVSVDQLVSDVEKLRLAGNDLMDAALPFDGRWYRRPTTIAPIQIASQLVQQEKLGEAAEYVEANRALLEHNPAYGLLAVWIGEEYAKIDGINQARYFFAEAESHHNDDYRVLNNLAWQYATQSNEALRDPAKAVELAELANAETRRSNVFVLDTLSVAYAAKDDLTSAIATAEQARVLARQQANTAMVRALTERIEAWRTETRSNGGQR